jgi:hypothetical protein
MTNSTIYITAVLASIDYLPLLELRFSSFLICQEISNYILCILNILLGDSRSFLKPMEHVNVFVLAKSQAG